MCRRPCSEWLLSISCPHPVQMPHLTAPLPQRQSAFALRGCRGTLLVSSGFSSTRSLDPQNSLGQCKAGIWKASFLIMAGQFWSSAHTSESPAGPLSSIPLHGAWPEASPSGCFPPSPLPTPSPISLGSASLMDQLHTNLHPKFCFFGPNWRQCTYLSKKNFWSKEHRKQNGGNQTNKKTPWTKRLTFPGWEVYRVTSKTSEDRRTPKTLDWGQNQIVNIS